MTDAAPVPEPLSPHFAADTRGLLRDDALDVWNSAFGSAQHVTPHRGSPRLWSSSLQGWDLGDTIFASLRGDAAACTRTAQQARRDGLETWVVTLLSGAGRRFQVGDRRITQEAGTLMLRRFADPHHFQCDAPYRAASLYFRADRVFPGSDLRNSAWRPLEGPAATFLAAHLTSLRDCLPELPRCDVPALAEMTRAALRLALLSNGAAGHTANDLTATQRIAQLLAAIEARLASARLSPELLARELGWSRATLYRVAEARGGVAAMIRQARLRAARRRLLDPAEAATVTQIALDSGFPDAASFSRAFSREFGHPPIELRRPVSQASRSASRDGATFTDLLFTSTG